MNYAQFGLIAAKLQLWIPAPIFLHQATNERQFSHSPVLSRLSAQEFELPLACDASRRPLSRIGKCATVREAVLLQVARAPLDQRLLSKPESEHQAQRYGKKARASVQPHVRLNTRPCFNMAPLVRHG